MDSTRLRERAQTLIGLFGGPVHARPGYFTDILEIDALGAGPAKYGPVHNDLALIPDHLAAP